MNVFMKLATFIIAMVMGGLSASANELAVRSELEETVISVIGGAILGHGSGDIVLSRAA